MVELTKEEREILEKLREADAKREQLLPSQRQPITNPGKYSFPIGLDDDGKPFDDSSDEKQTE